MKKLVLLMVIVGLVGGCGDKKSSNQHQNPPGWDVSNVKVAPNVIVVPDDMDVTVTSSSLEFATADARRLGTVREGTFLVSGKEFGFLRNVTAISETDETVIYQTRHGSLAEVLVSADISGSIPINFVDETQQRTKDVNFGVVRDGFQLYTGGMDLSLSRAAVSFQPSVDFDISFDGGSMEHFRMEVEGQFDGELAAQLTASAGGSYNNVATIWQSAPVTTTVWAGIVPIVLVTRLILDAGFGLTLDADASVEAGASLSAGVSLGAEYANGNWQPIATDNFTVSAIGPTLELDADANLRVYLRPKIECKLYDVAGPNLSLEPYGRFAASLLPGPPSWVLSAGVSVGMQVRVEMMDHLFVDWSETLMDKNWPLASGTFAGCADEDADSRDGYDAASCSTGEDHCDDNPNNWTTVGCVSCVDDDGDGFGVDCDKGEDCDDTDGTIHTGCAACGNGTIEAGEDCDDGNTTAGDGCSDTCALEVPPGCGNGVREHGEACDDGNTVDCDGCNASCIAESCGNGISECGEACDDGNTTDGDGCSSACAVEVTGVCGDGVLHPSEACDDGNTTDGDGCTATCTVETTGTCGDGQVHPAEGCDDGNTTACDGCSPTCVAEACGNGVPECAEECDDGNIIAGDGCNATCVLEVAPGCGNGVLEQGEACDDGNTADGDGCSAACQNEAPNDCGNGVTDAGEDCDDGNTVNGDGCSAQCQTEVPGVCQTDYVLNCGNLHAHNNGGPGSTQHIHSYGCTTLSETGPEYAYTFTAPVSGQAMVTLSQLTADLDVFVLDETGTPCDAVNSCVDHGDTEVSWSTTAGATYYVVVDGYQGAVSDYELVLTCGACGDGVVDPSEECDDGNTADGDGCSAGCLFEVAGSCSPATTISCGDTVGGNNGGSGSTTNIDMYGCGGWVETGPEYAYTFTPQTTQTVTVTKINATAQIDIYVLEDWGQGCAAEDCLDYHDVSVNFTAYAGTTYYIVMDGYQGDVGDYTIQLTCN